jgi:hypothetical protein
MHHTATHPLHVFPLHWVLRQLNAPALCQDHVTERKGDGGPLEGLCEQADLPQEIGAGMRRLQIQHVAAAATDIQASAKVDI